MTAFTSDFLADSNILLRSADPTNPMYQEARNAVDALQRRGERPCLAAQNLVEFRAVATRPANVNGLGFSQSQADAKIVRLMQFFTFSRTSQRSWRNGSGLLAYTEPQASRTTTPRPAVAMNVHGISKILTFNKSDFVRYPDLVVVTPSEVLTAS